MTKAELLELTNGYSFSKNELASLLIKINRIEEKWKPVSGYNGLYKVNNLGRVVSIGYIKIKVTDPYRPRIRNDREIFGHNGGKGYRFVTLKRNGSEKHIYIHRMVAAHFLRNPNNEPEVNHKYGNKRNNAVWNLEWGTRSKNIRHSHKHGFHKSQKGKLTSRSRITRQYDKNGHFINRYQSQTIAGIETGVKRNLIWLCVNGYQKTAGGYIWK